MAPNRQNHQRGTESVLLKHQGGGLKHQRGTESAAPNRQNHQRGTESESAAEMKRRDIDDFLLVRRGFIWINEVPFNRHEALPEI